MELTSIRGHLLERLNEFGGTVEICHQLGGSVIDKAQKLIQA